MTLDSARPARSFWRTCRVYFRRFRITVWTCVLLVVACLLYLNQVGLPSFLKQPLLQKLRTLGVDLQFSRLRLRWYQGIVAENVRFGSTGNPNGGELTAREVQLLLNLKALARARLQIDQIVVGQGSLVLPLGGTNLSAGQLSVTNIQTHLRFLPDDQWALDHFKADFAGASIELSGIVSNASAVPQWPFFQGHAAGPATPGIWPGRFERVAERLDSIRFSSPPELRLDVRGDARDLQSFTVRLGIEAPGAETPWGSVTAGRFIGRLLPVDTNGTARADIFIEASAAQTPWASATNLQLNLALMSAEARTNIIEGEMKIAAASVHTPWANATNALFSGTWVHSITNPVPLSGNGHFE